MLQLPRYQLQFAWLERYINKRYPGQEPASSSLLSFPLFVLLSQYRFFPVPPTGTQRASLVYSVRACVRALAVHLRDPEYHRSSRFLNSLRLLSYFLERKTSTRVGHSVSASIVSTSRFFDIYLSFVRIFHLFVSLSLPISLSLSPFFLRSRSPPSRSALVYLYLIFSSWVLDVKTDI